MRSNVTVSFFPLLVGAILVVATTPKAVHCQSAVLTTEELVQRADVVVVGKVTAMSSAWNSDRSRIYTRVTISVSQQIKGETSENSATVSIPGGEVDGIGEFYSHTASFKMDEEVVVFATKDRQGQLQVTGGNEGKTTVTKDETTGLRMVSDREPMGVFTSRLKRVVQAQSHRE